MSAAATSDRLALLAGGRTGGHVFPALAVAEELLARGWRVGMVGTATGLEARLAQERGLQFYPLDARPLVGRSLVRRLLALFVLLRSCLAARRLVVGLGASVVLGTGGYVSAPAVLGGRLAGRPVLLLEPNARVGLANRLLSRLAQGAAVAFESARAQLHCPAWLTGVPVRSAFFQIAERKSDPDRPFRLLVLGGSQGARVLNSSVPQATLALAQAASGRGIEVVHQCGAAHLDSTRQAYIEAFRARPGSVTPDVEIVPFLEDVAAAMGRSDLILSRAGAITVAECCAAGRPAILVPLRLAGAHQRDNALALVNAGAAVLVAEDELDALDRTLVDLYREPERLAVMGRLARGLARNDARRAIADHLEALWALRAEVRP